MAHISGMSTFTSERSVLAGRLSGQVPRVPPSVAPVARTRVFTLSYEENSASGMSAQCRTMAPDKSQLVNNLNNLLKLTETCLRSEQGTIQQVVDAVDSQPSSNGSNSHTQLNESDSEVSDSSTHTGQSSGQGNGYHEPIYKPVANASTLPPPLRSVDSEEYHPSDGWRPRAHHLTQDQLWKRIRDEAQIDAAMEPALATFLHSVVLSHSSMEGAMAFLLANKLADGLSLGPVQLMSLFREVYAADSSILASGIADLHAVLDRDPACAKFTQCLLYFKGYQAIQCYRITHYLWNQGRQMLALAIQAKVSELFGVDIHPAAVIGRGVMLDHATGIVIGETAVVGDNVSMLHHVSLGGSGLGRGARHPNIGHGVLLGAGVTVLGPIMVGAGSKVGAGSVVVADVPEHSVAVGVPARIVKRNLRLEPVREMDQCTDFIFDYVI